MNESHRCPVTKERGWRTPTGYIPNIEKKSVGWILTFLKLNSDRTGFMPENAGKMVIRFCPFCGKELDDEM